MRKTLATLALGIFCSFASPASADTLVTTGSSCNGSDCSQDIPARLLPFDSSLGVLTDITVGVDVTIETSHVLSNISGVPGIATFSTSGPADVQLMGTTYSVDVSGSNEVPYAAYDYIFGTGVTARGSATFSVDSSLFRLFVDRQYDCFGVQRLASVCAFSVTFIPPNLQTTGPVHMIDADGFALWTLTYTYSPAPEPSTWAMMLFGFAAIGLWTRRNRLPRALREGA